MLRRIYLDHAATTPVRPEALAAVSEANSTGNPSSIHREGQAAKRVLDSSRATVADSLGVRFSEITFTSGGTEADNAALLGVLWASPKDRRRLVISAIEHEAILKTAAFAERLGFPVTIVAPEADGIVSPIMLANSVGPDVALVSVMHANNEIGTIQPVRELGEIAHAAGALFHTDAVQSFAQIPVNASELGADLISISAHKIYGPRGVGALYVREGIPIEPLVHGGGQERERRAGTENVGGIAGFAAAVICLLRERDAASLRLAQHRDTMIARIYDVLPEARLNGCAVRRLPGNVNISLPGRDPETILLALDMEGVSASSGSACTSGSIEPSHVLRALGLTDHEIGATIRFTLGRETTEADVIEAIERLQRIVWRMSS